MPLFDSDVFLGNVDVLLPPGTESASSSCMDLGQPAVFPRNEIRISRRSPASERCPPLAVLQVISAYSLRCKLEAKAADLHPTSLLHRLHDSCWKKGMVYVASRLAIYGLRFIFSGSPWLAHIFRFMIYIPNFWNLAGGQSLVVLN